MPGYTQEERPLSVTTPLGKDALLILGLQGHEAVSHLFQFHLDLMADLETEIRFDRILGQNVTVEMRLPDGGKRYFNGIVKRFSQGARDKHFVAYRAEVVPKLWLLSKKVRSRIFQHLTIPQILQQVLTGIDVSFEISGTYYERDYCVQYRESDFAFASRLMEEEGIYYFFKHANGSHQMVVTDLPSKHPTVPGPAVIIYDEVEGEEKEDVRVTQWEKSQELRSGECTLWDQSFEVPGNPLEASETTIESVQIGKVTHKLRVGGNDQLEIYDYPGGYAQRFDGIDRVGGERPVDVQHIFEDRTRTVRIRMEQEEVAGLEIQGVSDCGHFTSGHEFTLDRHFDANGKFFLTRIEHDAKQADYRSEVNEEFQYRNRFTCIPSVLRYRPARVTPRPTIDGIQTAVVVGPPGEEIFVDKYGRIKVQFPWDREGKKNVDSSCWLRVAQIWAGNRWGAYFWPRIGHEVVVTFEDGDPDRPIVVGSVYNAANMPPLRLPIAKEIGGIKSESVRGRAGENYNSLAFVDVKGQEHLAIHSERHMILYAEYDVAQRSGRHHREWVPGVHIVSVGSIPGSGGSGGSEAETTPSTAKESGSVWSAPHPQAVLGLSATNVYGSAFTGSFPMSFQLAVGGLMKLIVDPIGFVEAFRDSPNPVPSMESQLLANGAFGTAQLTLGTAANVTMGQVYDVVIGPPKIHISSSNQTGSQLMVYLAAVIVGELALAYLIAYDAIGTLWHGDAHADDDRRAGFVMAFQLVMQVCIFTMIALANTHVDGLEKTALNAINVAFQTGRKPLASKNPASPLVLTASAITAAVLGSILPPVLDAQGESRLTSIDDSTKSS